MAQAPDVVTDACTHTNSETNCSSQFDCCRASSSAKMHKNRQPHHTAAMLALTCVHAYVSRQQWTATCSFCPLPELS
jgi:hypothetical protein